MREEDVATWLYERASAILTASSDLGAMEKALNQASREACRKVLERLVQEKATQQAMVCPHCAGKLNREPYDRLRKANMSFEAHSGILWVTG